MNTNTISIFDSDCIRKKSNWSKSNPDFKLDSKSFNPELFLKNIKSHSPKLHTLLQKIQKISQEVFSIILTNGQKKKALLV